MSAAGPPTMLAEVDRPASATRTALADIAPFALAVIPFGLAVGSAGASAGLSLPELMFGAVVLLAGAAQLAAIEAMGDGQGVLVVTLVVALVNLRFVIYGAGVATWFEHLPLWRRLLLAFPVVDQTFLLCGQRFDDGVEVAWRRRYYLVATAVLAGAFLVPQPLAYCLGTGLPSASGVHLAGPLTFAGMLARGVDGRRELVAGLVAGACVVMAAGPLGPAALPIGVLFGAGAASRIRGRS